ncbi:MAG: hypothetical protein U0T73_06925 [Chitinophagales bacterium]
MSSKETPFCHISGRKITASDGFLLEIPESEEFFTAVYEKIGLNYPKYFKMNPLCKLAIIAAELTLRQALKVAPLHPATALVLTTRNGSLDTDERYWQSTAAIPSPGLFVYTLANVMAGEICIRYGIKGENYCFVTEGFNRDFHEQQTQLLRKAHKANFILNGYADHLHGKSEAFFYFVAPENEKTT